MKIDFCGLKLPLSSEQRQSFPHGGLVTGPGTSTSDDVPSRIPVGSFVLNAAAVQIAGLATLEMINLLAIEGDVDLSDGEFVVQPASVAAFGKDFFERLNAAGQLQRAGALGDTARIMAYAECTNAVESVLCGRVEVRPAAVPTNGLAGGGMLGVAMGAGANTYNQLQQEKKRNSQVDAEIAMRQQSVAQQMALGGLRMNEAKTQDDEAKAIRAHIAKTRAGLASIAKGDYSPLAEKAALYNQQAPAFDNGHTVTIDGGTFEHFDPQGKSVGSAKLDPKTASQLYLVASDMEMRYLSPEYYKASYARAADAKEKELDRKNKTDVAGIYSGARMYASNAQSEASMHSAEMRAESSKYSADHRPAARSGGLTSTQDRSNLEIEAARKTVADLSPEDIRQRTAKTTNTGRDNPSYDPEIERAARLATRRKVGADDVFDQRQGGGAADQSAPAAAAFDRADVAKRFRSEGAMNNYTLGKETPNGIEVLSKGRVIGHYR